MLTALLLLTSAVINLNSCFWAFIIVCFYVLIMDFVPFCVLIKYLNGCVVWFHNKLSITFQFFFMYHSMNSFMSEKLFYWKIIPFVYLSMVESLYNEYSISNIQPLWVVLDQIQKDWLCFDFSVRFWNIY